MNNIKPVDIWLIMVQVRNPNHFWDKGQRRGQFWIFKVLTMSCFSNLVRFPDMNHKKDIKMCQRRVTKKNFMKFWQRAAEIWDLKEGQNCDFSSPISQQPFVRTSWIFFWWLSYYNSQFDISWPCLGTSPFLRKKTWLKPWKSKNATFSGLVLWHGWDFGHGHKESLEDWVSVVPHTEFWNFPIKWSWDIWGPNS